MPNTHRLIGRITGPAGDCLHRVATRRSPRWATSALLAALALCCIPSTAAASARSVGAPAAPVGLPHGLGLISTPSVTASSKATARAAGAVASLPASVDLTPYAMPAGNQGNVGSCAAWATDYTALGYWEDKQGIGGGALEPMYTYSQVTGGVDDGSSIEGNLQIDERGIDAQADYWQGNFDFSDLPTAAEKARAVDWKLSSYSDLPIVTSSSSTVTQGSIETALAAGDPVVIGIPVYDNFFGVTAANGGFYAGPSGTFEGDHAVTALGYNSTGLVIENSWGTGWGKGGFATLSWAFVNGDVLDAVSVGPLSTGQPVSSTAPAVTGSGREGQALTASSGSWSPAATSYAYQWQRAPQGSSDWSVISGATGSTYTPVAADLGASLRVSVTASDSTGQGESVSAPLGPITSGAPSLSTAPAITGTLREGQTLTATSGSWSPAATSYTYQWQRSTNAGSSWSNITGATGAAYLTTVADINADERVVVTAINSFGATPATSASVGPVSGLPYSTAAPTVTGLALEGQTLTATSGSWNPAATSYAYQWQRSTNGGTTWVSVSGMTGPTYTLEPSDVSNDVRIQVTATNASGSTIAWATIGPIASDAPRNTVVPVIAGAATRGSQLTVGTGTWSPAGTSYSYQWQHSSNGGTSWTNITGATTTSYTPGVSDETTELRVIVTAVDSYGTATATSAATQPVTASPPAATAAPALSGTATVGAKLTATTGAWSGAGNVYTYQWQHESGTTWSNISAATSATYTLAGSDRGDHVRVLVTATNPDGSASDASAVTATVAG